MYIILDVQLLSELESLAAVLAEVENEQEDLYMTKDYFRSLMSTSTTCSEDVVCLEILLSTQRKQPGNTSNSKICLLSWVACYVCNWSLVRCILVWERFVMLVS